MAIYTKTGDKGTTGLFDGTRVAKNSERVNTYGTLDELNAHLSVCEKLVRYPETKTILHRLQGLLFQLCAEVATVDQVKLKQYSTLVSEADIKELETVIDHYTQALPPLRSFIYQGNNLAAAELHVARTVCRRAERMLNGMRQGEPVRPTALAFVNRLSDCIYTLARMEDFIFHVDEIVTKVVAKLEHLPASVTTEETASKAVQTARTTKGVTVTNFGEASALDSQQEAHVLRRMAQQLLEGATAKSEAMGVPVVIAVVDRHGNPVLTYRMVDALLVSTDIAEGKAYTAVALKCKTEQLNEVTQPGAELYQIESMVTRPLVTFGGGFPLTVAGRIIGGLGISGGTVAEDIAIGKYAMDYMEANYGK